MHHQPPLFERCHGVASDTFPLNAHGLRALPLPMPFTSGACREWIFFRAPSRGGGVRPRLACLSSARKTSSSARLPTILRLMFWMTRLT